MKRKILCQYIFKDLSIVLTIVKNYDLYTPGLALIENGDRSATSGDRVVCGVPKSRATLVLKCILKITLILHYNNNRH